MLVTDIEAKISYVFNDKKLLKQAMTHSSYSGEFGMPSNERLEFIGDAFLDAVIGHDLFRRLPYAKEGVLSKTRAQIVCAESLAAIGIKLGLDKEIFLGHGEENNSGRNNKNIIADALEALIGALYLDGGFTVTEEFIELFFNETIDKAIAGELNFDYKSRLQEIIQKKYGNTPIKYAVVSESGPEHRKHFNIQVEIQGKILGLGEGSTKKEAEKEAAKYALQKGDF